MRTIIVSVETQGLFTRLGDDLLHTFADDVVIVRNEHLDHVWAVRVGMRTETIVPRPATPSK